MPKSFKDKLTNFEMQPPQAAWNNISHELNENKDLQSLSNRLFDFEVATPDVWRPIVTSLKIEGKAPLNFSITKRKRTALLYALAAAAVLGAISIIISHLNTASINNNLAVNSAGHITHKNAQPEKAVVNPAPVIEEQSANIDEEVPYLTIAKTSKSNREDSRVLQTAVVKSTSFPDSHLKVMIAAKPIRNSNGDIIQDPEINSNAGSEYISITSPNGQQAKISSKFLHLLLFINDDNDIDKVDGYFDKNFLESLVWKSRFNDWRNEIMGTSLVPSATNFMDILDLKDLIIKNN